MKRKTWFIVAAICILLVLAVSIVKANRPSPQEEMMDMLNRLENALGDEWKKQTVYERFVLEYYKQHHTYLDEARSAQVKWNLDEDADDAMIRFLPVMQTDIFLRCKEKTLIIDTKYYGKTMQKQYDSYTLHSNNLYQIFTYVKNHDRKNTGNVSGMLLYAKTQESITPDCVFPMGGNQISVKTLDLNLPFSGIAAQLDKIAENHFGVRI